MGHASIVGEGAVGGREGGLHGGKHLMSFKGRGDFCFHHGVAFFRMNTNLTFNKLANLCCS